MMMISLLLLSSVGAATNPEFCNTHAPASDPLFPAAEWICQVSETRRERLSHNKRLFLPFLFA